jgi:PPOX class probable F420-dependent enzyme
MLTEPIRHFLNIGRVGHLATADTTGVPHVLPVCYAVSGEALYITIDEKPKRPSVQPLKRLANILQNPAIAVCVDRYDEDWSRLAWVMLRGRAEVLADGREHDRAQTLLRERYVQYQTMRIEELPVIALRIERVTSWGAI